MGGVPPPAEAIAWLLAKRARPVLPAVWQWVQERMPPGRTAPSLGFLEAPRAIAVRHMGRAARQTEIKVQQLVRSAGQVELPVRRQDMPARPTVCPAPP